MVSNIDETKPVTGIDQPAKVMRDNFTIAKIEITELQARKFESDGSSIMTGPLELVSFLLAELPPAIDNEASLVYVSDAPTPGPFYSDGLSWKAVGSEFDDLVDDTTPQLGGDLDVNGFSIVSVSDGNIPIAPDGTGVIILDGLSWPFADGTNGQVLTTDGAGNLSFTTSGGLTNVVDDTTPQLGGELDAQNNKIINLATPTVDADATTKLYVDSLAAGLDPKESVRLATVPGDLSTFTFVNNGGVGDTLTAPGAGFTSVDGTNLADGDRALVKNQADAKENGIYVASDTGSGGTTVLTRATDQDGTPSNEVSAGNFTFVETGSVNGSTGWVVIGDGVITINVGDIDWAQFSDVSGGGLNNIVEDLTPQLGGQLDVNTFGLGDGTNLLLDFVEDASAVNYIEIENEATGSGPIIRSVGADTNVDLSIEPKGTGDVIVGITGPSEMRGDTNESLTVGGGDSDSTATGGDTTIVSGDGSGAFSSGSVFIAPGTGGAGDGSLILDGLIWPIVDGSSGQALTTNGAGTLGFASVGAASSISNLIEDTTPQLGGNLDVNGKGISFGGSQLVLGFASGGEAAVNWIDIEHALTGSGPIIRSVGPDTNVDLNIEAKGTGAIVFASPLALGPAPLVALDTVTDVGFVIPAIAAGPPSFVDVAFGVAAPTAVVGDSVVLGFLAILPPGLMFNAFVIGPTAIIVRVADVTGAGFAGAPLPLKATVMSF